MRVGRHFDSLYVSAPAKFSLHEIVIKTRLVTVATLEE